VSINWQGNRGPTITLLSDNYRIKVNDYSLSFDAL